MKIIIVGGVAAGMSAAAKAKREDGLAKVTVYERGSFISYAGCGLPYYISGITKDYNQLIARTPKEFQENGIDVKTLHEVKKILPQENKVLVENLKTNERFYDRYDKLMIATGASPIKLPIIKKGLGNVFTLKTIEDAMAIRKELQNPKIKDIVIVGAGYIGMELVDNLVNFDKNIRILELTDRVLPNFEKEISEIVLEELLKNDIMVNLNEGIQEVVGDDRVSKVRTDKDIYSADMVIFAIGVRPNTKFLEGSGIAMDRGAIVIDNEARTNVKDIFAAGDCAMVYHKLLKGNRYIPLGTTANKLGRIAGENMVGKKTKFPGTLGSSVIKILDLEVARTGIGVKEAQDLGIECKSIFVKTKSHAGYYPNTETIYIKLIYEKKGQRILGAQLAGKKGVAGRCGIFSTAIFNNMTTQELGMLDLPYAPPFATVWDAVNIAANVAK